MGFYLRLSEPEGLLIDGLLGLVSPFLVVDGTSEGLPGTDPVGTLDASKGFNEGSLWFFSIIFSSLSRLVSSKSANAKVLGKRKMANKKASNNLSTIVAPY